MKLNLLTKISQAMRVMADKIATQPAPRVPVDSSVIASIGYHNGTLEVEFKNGRVYTYAEVPRRLYERLMLAESKGKFFNAHIRDTFDFTPID